MKIEMPKSLFGKHKYSGEQLFLVIFMDYLTRGAGAVDLAFLGLPSSERIPAKFRMPRAIKNFRKAKEALNEIGIT